MSRSYKKFPLWKDERSCKTGKITSNNKVRTYLKSNKDIPNGKAYKKIFDSWNICDCRLSTTLKEWIKKYGDSKYKWYKSYKMK